MIKKHSGLFHAAIGAAGVLAAAAVTPQARAADDLHSQAKAAANQKIDKMRMVRITVKDVDPGEHKVTFEAHVSPEAKVQGQAGEPIMIDQLKPGDTLTAAIDPKTGDLVAAKVTKAASSQGTGSSSDSSSSGSGSSSDTSTK
jgi:hypothetical protein